MFCLSAGQTQLIQQVTSGPVLPGAVHRPQVQKISNNIVTLSNVQSPAVYSTNPNLLQAKQSTSLQTISVPAKADSNNRGIILILSFDLPCL